MHDKEIQYFSEGLNLAKNEFYLDSINKFNMLIDEFPESDLADDALYNVGLCYFKLKQFEQAIETFNQVIINYPDATISVLDNGNEFGKTAAKCHYGCFQCYLLLNEIDNAEAEILKLKSYNQSTYIIVDNKKVSFEHIATNLLNQLKNKI
jgi:tetratricopeptide (TPR) repeat protein